MSSPLCVYVIFVALPMSGSCLCSAERERPRPRPRPLAATRPPRPDIAVAADVVSASTRPHDPMPQMLNRCQRLCTVHCAQCRVIWCHCGFSFLTSG